MTTRKAQRDTVLPRGGGPDGASPLLVPAGATVTVSIHALHRDRQLWGDDSLEFKPERWIKVEKGMGGVTAAATTTTRTTTTEDGVEPTELGEHLEHARYTENKEDLRASAATDPQEAERNRTRREWRYMPFLRGPRGCLGQRLALNEARYVVVRLLQSFERLEVGEGPEEAAAGGARTGSGGAAEEGDGVSIGEWRESISLSAHHRDGTRVIMM